MHPLHCVELVVACNTVHGSSSMHFCYVRDDDVLFNDPAFLEMFQEYEDATAGVSEEGRRVLAKFEELRRSGRIVKSMSLHTDDGGSHAQYFAAGTDDGILVTRKIASCICINVEQDTRLNQG